MMVEMHHPREILLVDDDSLEAVIIQRVLRDLALSSELVHVTDGDQALAHLRNREAELPCAILLDLNMPKMTGIEFLEIVKADKTLARIPVIVVTTSQREQDRARSFELGAAAYIVKATGYDEFRREIGIIEQYLASVQPSERDTVRSDR